MISKRVPNFFFGVQVDVIEAPKKLSRVGDEVGESDRDVGVRRRVQGFMEPLLDDVLVEKGAKKNQFDNPE
jgi:hypothetical protein